MFLRSISFVIAAAVGVSFSAVAEAQINTNMVNFAKAKLNVRVGGGECAHLATEALRVSGGEFLPADLGADSPATGDYVWGTLLTIIAYSGGWSDSSPSTLCQPGDVIQYGGSVKMGKTSFPTRHTSIIAAVNTSGRPTSVYQQNFGGKRTVQQATIDTKTLTAGWLRIYRPIARIDRANEWKFTVVNNASTGQSYSVMVGTSTVSSVSLTALNTAGSFRIHRVVTTGTLPNVVISNGQSLFVQTAKGNEIYNPTTSTIGVRQLSQ